MADLVRRRTKDGEKGASLTEYALTVALIAGMAIVAVRRTGRKVANRFERVEEGLSINGTSNGG